LLLNDVFLRCVTDVVLFSVVAFRTPITRRHAGGLDYANKDWVNSENPTFLMPKYLQNMRYVQCLIHIWVSSIHLYVCVWVWRNIDVTVVYLQHDGVRRMTSLSPHA